MEQRRLAGHVTRCKMAGIIHMYDLLSFKALYIRAKSKGVDEWIEPLKEKPM